MICTYQFHNPASCTLESTRREEKSDALQELKSLFEAIDSHQASDKFLEMNETNGLMNNVRVIK